MVYVFRKNIRLRKFFRLVVRHSYQSSGRIVPELVLAPSFSGSWTVMIKLVLVTSSDLF